MSDSRSDPQRNPAPGASDITGIVFDIDRFSVHDGPGVRTTVYLKGCPLRCVWCHSPDSVRPTPQLVFRESRCVHCGHCVEACPRGAQVMAAPASPDGEPERQILWDRCDDCGRCVDTCLGLGLELWGKRMSAAEVVSIVARQGSLYRQSGGGITLTGGEAMMQLRFVQTILQESKQRGIHTAIETCGYVPWSSYERVLPFVDLFLYDVKCMDPERHTRYTGVDNDQILSNFRRLTGAGAVVVARLPLIPGHNDDEANVIATAEFVRAAGGAALSLLPYNAATGARYAWLGREYALEALVPQSEETIERLAAGARAQGVEVRVGF